MATMRVTGLAIGVALLATGCGGGGNPPTLPSSFVVTRSQDNPIVTSDGTFTELLRLDLEPGRYEVTGKVELHNRDGAVPFDVQCALVPSNPDGSPGQTDGLESDWGFRHLERFGEGGDMGGIVLLVSQQLDNAGSVLLGCEGSGSSEAGAFAAYTSVRAIEVESIATTRFTP